jgi:hypothetical protein
MPRVHTQVARKDYPEIGVTKGQTYYKWTFRNRFGRGTVMKSKTFPKPHELTRSEYMSAALLIQERVNNLSASSDLPGEVEDIISDLRQLASEQEDKFNNMPEGLQQGDTGQLLEERKQNCEDYADELEGVDLSEFSEDTTEGPCDACSGTGKINGEECGTCNGTGEVTLDEPLNSDEQTEEEYWQAKLEEVQNCSFNM